MRTLGIDAFSSRNNRSGVEWYTHHLLRAMKQITPEDWRVFLFGLGEDDFTRDIANENWTWKNLRWWPRRGWGHLRLSWEMWRRPVNTLFVPAAMIPLIHPHRPWRHRWTVTTIPDAAFLQHPDLYDVRDRRRQTMALSFASHHAARIFVPSEATRAAIKELVDDEQVRVIPLGVDHEQYHFIDDQRAKDAVRAKYNLTKPFLLYVGRVDKKKNLPDLVRGYADSKKEGELIIVGEKGFGGEEVVDEIKKFGLEDAVRLLGYVSEADLPALYNAAMALVFPSKNEGFGLPVLEALACGTPAVVADIPVIREVAGEAAVFVADGRWTEAIDRVTGDVELRGRLREAGFVQAQKFSWKKCAEQTWLEIQSLAG